MTVNPFNSFTNEYEAWYQENNMLFQSELLALMQVIPFGKKGLEIALEVAFLQSS